MDPSDRCPAATSVPGDAQARFSRLLLLAEWNRVAAYVQSHLPRVLATVLDPADVLQDVMIAAAKRIEHFNSTSDDGPYKWLVAISRNHMSMLLRHYRRQKRGGHLRGSGVAGESLQLLLADAADPGRSPSRSAAAHEAAARLMAAVDRLPKALQTAVRLRYIEGLTPAEVAVQMGRTVGAVTQLCARALRVLRADLRSAAMFP